MFSIQDRRAGCQPLVSIHRESHTLNGRRKFGTGHDAQLATSLTPLIQQSRPVNLAPQMKTFLRLSHHSQPLRSGARVPDGLPSCHHKLCSISELGSAITRNIHIQPLILSVHLRKTVGSQRNKSRPGSRTLELVNWLTIDHTQVRRMKRPTSRTSLVWRTLLHTQALRSGIMRRPVTTLALQSPDMLVMSQLS
jgi:hypothetical protein